MRTNYVNCSHSARISLLIYLYYFVILVQKLFYTPTFCGVSRWVFFTPRRYNATTVRLELTISTQCESRGKSGDRATLPSIKNQVSNRCVSNRTPHSTQEGTTYIFLAARFLSFHDRAPKPVRLSLPLFASLSLSLSLSISPSLSHVFSFSRKSDYLPTHRVYFSR